MPLRQPLPRLPLLLILYLLATIQNGHRVTALTFTDVTQKAGLRTAGGRRRKYGGAAVADLDGDGYPDFITSHHDERFTQVFFNNGDGTFSLADFKLWRDVHGINPFRLAPGDTAMHFAVSEGASFGRNPTTPSIFRVARDRSITDITSTSGVNVRVAKGRGRSAVCLNLHGYKASSQDLLFTNGKLSSLTKRHHKAFENRRRKLVFRKLTGPFPTVPNKFAAVADVDADGRLEVVSFEDLRIHRVTGSFNLVDISDKVLPSHIATLRGTIAVAELDFDNDGRWDLYVARSGAGELAWVSKATRHDHDDYLLRNVGGRYVDVSRQAGVRLGGHSSGVTVGDFNNDGFVDLLVTRFESADVFLINNGDGTFRKRNAGFRRPKSIHGDQGTAVDYDRDGKLDVLLSEGDWHKQQFGGHYRLMHNVGAGGRYLLVRVRSSWSGQAVSLHAVVKVFVGNVVLMRRVGSPGTAVSNSYIELVHFGLGELGALKKVVVRWTDGSSQSKTDVRADSMTTFGR